MRRTFNLRDAKASLRGRVTWAIRFSKIRDSLERLAELNSPAMITEDFVKYCIDRIDIRAEGDVMKLTISLVTGKIAEKRLNTEKEPSPQIRDDSWYAGLNEALTAVRSWRVPPAR